MQKKRIKIILACALGVLVGTFLIANLGATKRPYGGTHINTFLESADASAALAAIGAMGLPADPNADRILFWDDSAGASAWLIPGTSLNITGTTLDLAAPGVGSGTYGSGTQVAQFYVNSYGVLTNAANVAIDGLDTAVIDTGIFSVPRGGSGAGTVTGVLKGNGTSAFTGLTGTQYGATYWSDANTIGTTLAPGSTTVFLRGNTAGAPTWDDVDLGTADVTGTLTVNRGGSGAATFTAGYLKASGTSAFTTVASVPNTDVTGLGTMSTQNANAVAITGGTITGSALQRQIVNVGSGTNTLAATQSGALVVNDAAAGYAIVNLPNATAGMYFSFRITDLDGMQINAFTGETISIGNATSAAAGYWCSSNVIGNRVVLVAKTSATWVDESGAGTWSMDQQP